MAIRCFGLARSRLSLIERFISSGWQVVVASVIDDYAAQLSASGAILEPVSFKRGGLSPLSDTEALLKLVRVYRKYQPRLIHHFHAKPIILGGLASYFVPGANVVNTITGLGHAFIQGGLAYHLSTAGYKLTLARGEITIFQNPDDLQLFVENRLVPVQKAKLIVSSGVDTKHFCPTTKAHSDTTRILMVARLLWQKGVKEFVEAAELVKDAYPNTCFQLAGEQDSVHPDAVDLAWIHTAVTRGTIQFLGYVDNMADQLRQSDLFVLPSSYREGVPRVLLEAAACGVPVVTTDTPGCREAVRDGVTGRLVPPQDSAQLAAAIIEILADKDLRIHMGQSGRKLIEDQFDIRAITEQYLTVYRNIGIEI